MAGQHLNQVEESLEALLIVLVEAVGVVLPGLPVNPKLGAERRVQAQG